MVKKYVVQVVVIGSIGLMSAVVFANCGTCGMDSAKTEKASSATAALRVNNAICPVSGEPVSSMNPVEVEYKGKIYNLCCPACIAPFKADPEKYIAKIGEQKAK